MRDELCIIHFLSYFYQMIAKFFAVFLLLSAGAYAQTNVSGGIFSNTIWTKANSPYILTDTVVVFPGITLTIQPGVEVRFDSQIQLELRQAKLIAIGTMADSITFTSNSASPIPGIYSSVYLNGGSLSSKFRYCNFYYADKGISHFTASTDSLFVAHSNFRFNNYGILENWVGKTIASVDSSDFSYNIFDALYAFGNVNYCNVSHNKNGITCGGGGLLTNCTVMFNSGTGIFGSKIYNCYVANNGIGCYGPDWILNSTIANNSTGAFASRLDNCSVINNQNGIITATNTGTVIKNCTINMNSACGITLVGVSNYSDSVTNCDIENGGIGIDINTSGNQPDLNFVITKNRIESNSIGIRLNHDQPTISCNKICNNATYDLKYSLSTNVDVANNYWCTPDSASTQAVIWDAHDNISLGIVNYMPFDSLCYLGNPTSVHEIESNQFSIYPNPASGIFLADFQGRSYSLVVFNVMGEEVYSDSLFDRAEIDISSQPSGIYFLRIQTGEGVVNRKIVLQK